MNLYLWEMADIILWLGVCGFVASCLYAVVDFQKGVSFLLGFFLITVGIKGYIALNPEPPISDEQQRELVQIQAHTKYFKETIDSEIEKNGSISYSTFKNIKNQYSDHVKYKSHCYNPIGSEFNIKINESPNTAKRIKNAVVIEKTGGLFSTDKYTTLTFCET